MNKEEIISSAVMSLVSLLMIIGFTVAWYSGNQENAVVTGMKVFAGETGTITIALESEGEDISILKSNDILGDECVTIGLDELTNIDGEIAPGAFGDATFFLTPKSDEIRSCRIEPTLGICVDGEWYFGEEDGQGESNAQGEPNAEEPTKEELYEIATRHIVFYKDELMAERLDENTLLEVEWTDEEFNDGQLIEKSVPVYWQWYYEYPFTAEEAGLSNAEKAEKIKIYDDEDMILGNHISDMKFIFQFIVS